MGLNRKFKMKNASFYHPDAEQERPDWSVPTELTDEERERIYWLVYGLHSRWHKSPDTTKNLAFERLVRGAVAKKREARRNGGERDRAKQRVNKVRRVA